MTIPLVATNIARRAGGRLHGNWTGSDLVPSQVLVALHSVCNHIDGLVARVELGAKRCAPFRRTGVRLPAFRYSDPVRQEEAADASPLSGPRGVHHGLHRGFTMRQSMLFAPILLLATLIWTAPPAHAQQDTTAGPWQTYDTSDGEWRSYAGDIGGRKYSPLDQIDAEQLRRPGAGLGVGVRRQPGQQVDPGRRRVVGRRSTPSSRRSSRRPPTSTGPATCRAPPGSRPRR